MNVACLRFICQARSARTASIRAPSRSPARNDGEDTRGDDEHAASESSLTRIVDGPRHAAKGQPRAGWGHRSVEGRFLDLMFAAKRFVLGLRGALGCARDETGEDARRIESDERARCPDRSPLQIARWSERKASISVRTCVHGDPRDPFGGCARERCRSPLDRGAHFLDPPWDRRSDTPADEGRHVIGWVARAKRSQLRARALRDPRRCDLRRKPARRRLGSHIGQDHDRSAPRARGQLCEELFDLAP